MFFWNTKILLLWCFRVSVVYIAILQVMDSDIRPVRQLSWLEDVCFPRPLLVFEVLSVYIWASPPRPIGHNCLVSIPPLFFPAKSKQEQVHIHRGKGVLAET